MPVVGMHHRLVSEASAVFLRAKRTQLGIARLAILSTNIRAFPRIILAIAVRVG